MIDFPRHRRSSPQNRRLECGEETYDMAVAWCRERIHSCGRGRDDDGMLFSPRAFHVEIVSASSKFGMPFEVRDGGGKDPKVVRWTGCTNFHRMMSCSFLHFLAFFVMTHTIPHHPRRDTPYFAPSRPSTPSFAMPT